MEKRQVPWSPPEIGDEEKEAAKKVIDSEWITQGKVTKAFEEAIAKQVNAKHAVAVSNGTCALMSSLLAHGIKPGDEVIVPNYTFVATINSVLAVGAKPILVDCDEKNWNTTPELIGEKITPKTKAFMPVDVAGMSVDIKGFQDLAEDKNLTFIQDSAESIGGEYKGKPVGSFDNTSIFSFHMAKLVAAVEGGCVLTNDDKLAEKIRMIRNHGMQGRYDYGSFGLNYRTTDVQAAIGIEQLKKLNKFLKLRNDLVDIYKKNLENVTFQESSYVTKHPHMIFGVLVDPIKRDDIIKKLNENGIGTRVCWPATHEQSYHKTLFKGNWPVTEKLSHSIINVPMGNALVKEDVEYVCEVFNKIQ